MYHVLFYRDALADGDQGWGNTYPAVQLILRLEEPQRLILRRGTRILTDVGILWHQSEQEVLAMDIEEAMTYANVTYLQLQGGRRG